ncbi:MAG: ABC transporter substrate-binding protein [Firmicutes bacterium]|nr:ABC transporter substrate-binding protein [Bacillota bacterium]
MVDTDNKGNFIPKVAESWEISEDGNTWTFKIRENIKFHNGDQLTAHDVLFTVERFIVPESTNPWSPYLGKNLDSMEVLDEYTFVYRTKTPEPPLLIAFNALQILPKNYIEEVGIEEFRKKPVGSGPWKFVEYISKTSLKLEANTDYWGKVPAYQYVVDLLVPEEMTRINMLRTGDVDIALNINTDRVVELEGEDGIRSQVIGNPTTWNISFPGTWITDKPTSDIRVRQAMSYAINRQEIVDTFYVGKGQPGGFWFMHPGGYGWDPAWKTDEYDPERAQQLLADAGYPDAFKDPTITYYTPAGPGVDQAALLQGYWEEIGLKVDVEVVDQVQFQAMFLVREEDPKAPNIGNIFPWSTAAPTNSMYHSANMYTSKGVHTTGHEPEIDELYNKALTEIDPDLALQYWREFRETVHAKYTNVGIVMLDTLVLVGPKLGEFTNNTHLTPYYTLNHIMHP